jgi:hydroxymethylpyrimidine pyrophosphatase-like HAD family hydrolase
MGLLLNEHQEITQRTRTVVKELQRRGALVMLSTARPPRSIRSIHQELGLTDPVITYNGAMAYDPIAATPIFHHAIPNPIALEVLAAIRAVDSTLNVGLELADQWYFDRIDERITAMVAAGK